jgi:hypothetical protein
VSGGDDGGLGEALRRIETLIAALGELPDPAAREPARELLETVLDLHGLALARMMALAAAAEGGTALVERLVADDQVRAVLLLHGLHPQAAEERVRRAVDRLQADFGHRGVRLALVRAGPDGVRLRVERGGHASGDEAIRREIEDAIVEAAPDIADLVIEGLEAISPASAVALAG